MQLTKELVDLIAALAWPVTVLLVVLVLYSRLRDLGDALVESIKKGAGLETPWFSVTALPDSLVEPDRGEPVTVDHMAMIHSSWRYPRKDKDFDHPMYAFHAVIQARENVLDRIEYVEYMLHKTYPDRLQTVTDRNSRFKLKELAWGESLLRAKVKVKDQEELVELSRYINLAQSGPRI